MYSWKDKIVNWVDSKGALTHILIGVLIAVLISSLIMLGVAAGKGAYDTQIEELETSIGGVSTSVSHLTTTMNTAQAQITSIGNKATANQAYINDLEGRLAEAEGNITDIRDSLAEVTASPLEAYLTGAFGNYTLHAKVSDAGHYTANIHLIYLAPFYVGNVTTYDDAIGAFYAGINWTAVNITIPAYAPVVSFNGTAWGLSQVWWNIGTFILAANNETAIPILFGGLSGNYTPDFAYAEIYKVVK
jgi:hypothetical protein